MTEVEVTSKHPFLDDDLQLISNWREWRKQWDANPILEIRLGLLHVGFDVKVWFDEDSSERLRFYMAAADRPEVYGISSELFKAYDQLADKAFAVLSQHFFKNRAEDSREDPSWLYWVAKDPALLEALMHFFRPGRYNGLHNLKLRGGVHAREAEAFLQDFLKSGWLYPDRGGFRRDEGQAGILKGLRPRFLQIMEASGVLVNLLRWQKDYGLDEETLDHLHMLALAETKFRGQEKILVGSVEEAILEGSEAARVYILAKICHEEEIRRNKLREIVRQEQELEERRKKLTSH